MWLVCDICKQWLRKFTGFLVVVNIVQNVCICDGSEFHDYIILRVSYSFAHSTLLFPLYHISVTFPALVYSSALKMEPCSPETFLTTDLIAHFHDPFLA